MELWKKMLVGVFFLNTVYIDDNAHTKRYTQDNTASPLVYNNMGWLGDSSHRAQGR